MAITTAYTLQEARDMLELWKECERALATGQAKAYKIGTREFTAIDLPEITRSINKYSNLVDSLSRGVKTNRVVRVVPRDL